MSLFYLHNEQWYTSGTPSLEPQNRSFQYGDGLFETMMVNPESVHLWPLHYNRLLLGLGALKMNAGELPPEADLQNQIGMLLKKNRIESYARVRLTLYRNRGGKYAPDSAQFDYLLECEPLTTKPYQLNTKGLFASEYVDIPKAASSISPYKTTSALNYVMAGIYKKEKKLDEVFIVNTQGLVIESLASNIFWLRNGILFTPHIQSGCVAGVMRSLVMDLATRQGLTLRETDGASPDDLEQAEEVFVTNSVQGIQWVLAWNSKRYYLNEARKLSDAIARHFGI